MNIGQLIKSITVLGFMGGMDLQISGLSCHSQKVMPGDIFIAIKGFETDGHLFLKDALEKGACALVIEDKKVWKDPFLSQLNQRGVSVCLVPDTRFALAMMADEFYGHPSRHLRVIGVTGTNGKTTTCALISKILEKAGERTGWMTTLDYRVGKDILPSQRTTPESLDLHRLLSKIVEAGCGWSVLEVSSHSLALDRVAGCWFDAAVLTNITQDHIDFHKTKSAYQGAKARLFEMLDTVSSGRSMDKVTVLNIDDQASRQILAQRKAKQPHNSLTITYGIEHEADVYANNILELKDGLRFSVTTPWGELFIQSPLIGRPNVYNILAALCVTQSFGIDSKAAVEGIKEMSGVPGRFERIRLGQSFEVVIDYAHTEDALSKLLSVARRHSEGRLICVFGCGGDRDKSKRPLMGRTAASKSDWTILTSDNPRWEDPSVILREIEEGFLSEGTRGGYEVCLDRRLAIFRAVSMARPGDIVVIAGKGHETIQIIGSEAIAFDDREVAKQAIHDLMNKGALARE